MLSQSEPLDQRLDDCGGDISSIDLQEGTYVPDILTSTRNKIKENYWRYVALLLLITCNTLLFILLWLKFGPQRLQLGNGQIHHDGLSSPIIPPGINDEKYIPIRWSNEYSSATIAGMDEVDRNWDDINASLGIVSISHGLAAKYGLPPSQDDPRDHSKGIYTIEAYHSLHCLVIIRHSMFQLARGEKLDVHFGHSTHCLGALMQAILCNADATLLYQKDGSGPGDGQARKCRNWPALRDWAKEHSACMHTNSSGLASQDVEKCDKDRMGDNILLSDWPEA
ncbi:hypothetical protein F5Y11DRAFT_313574 [Daldinia sp. FL1419]|nr:hypothetical protein F5Y11DRAFT_313574 [Daldinia sp. FL1419]